MSDREYQVGYGKPPAQHQFKKGQSGNRRGRPREVKNLRTLLLEEGATLITVNEGGKQRKITKSAALMKRLWADALGGKSRALTQLLQLVNRLEADTYESPEEMARDIHACLRLIEEREGGANPEERAKREEQAKHRYDAGRSNGED